MAALIRPYRPSDAPSLPEIYRRSVEQLGGRCYSPAQVAAWASLVPTAEAFDALSHDGRLRLVAADGEGRPVAFADLEPDGHLQFLYCAPEAAGRGVTAALWAALEQAARERGIARLYAEASELARPFLLSRGFVETARRDFEVAGVPIHNYAVEKRLAG